MVWSTSNTLICGGLIAIALLFAQAQADSRPGVPYLGQEDVCNGFICLYGGTCLNSTGQARCACVPGFTGRICETIISVPVKGGACPPLPPDARGRCPGYLCDNDAVCPGSEKCCQTGCSTKVCARPVATQQQVVGGATQTSVCDGYCLHNGLCTESNGVPSCSCPEGYGGERCNVTFSASNTKPGGCPSLQADLTGQCTGTACTDDATCPGAQKCCINACSTNVCSEPVPDSARCDIKTCPTGSTCFQIRSSKGGQGEAKCVLDADRTCWASGYARAHVIPSMSQPGQFDTIPCGSFTWFSLVCPLGTRCSASGITSPSVCCSDLLVTPRFKNAYWSRRLHVYRREAGNNPCNGCPVGQRCVAVQCYNPPCATQYECRDETD